MRHLNHRHKLGVKTAHRAALLASLSSALIRHKRIETTLAKAKALRPFVEQVITLAKKASAETESSQRLHFRRRALAKVRDPEAVAILFNERAEEFAGRSGGYTRIYKLAPRLGDGAEMALIELIDADDEGYPKRKRKASGKKAKKEAPSAEAGPAVPEAATAVADGADTADEGESEKKD